MWANLCLHPSRITVVTMAGAAIPIDDAAQTDTVRSVKQRVFAANNKLFVRRQRLVYMSGLYGMNPLADNETLGGAGVAQDGSAELDVLLADLTAAEAEELGQKVWFSVTPFSYCVGFAHIIQAASMTQFCSNIVFSIECCVLEFYGLRVSMRRHCQALLFAPIQMRPAG
jgi:hypothetical protein